MNYRVGFFILAVVLGGLVSYMIFKPKEVDNSYVEDRMKQSKIREDSLISELNQVKYKLSVIENEKIKIIAIYDTISKPALLRRSDSIYKRHGLN